MPEPDVAQKEETGAELAEWIREQPVVMHDHDETSSQKSEA